MGSSGDPGAVIFRNILLPEFLSIKQLKENLKFT
jgi:hypothetical protein